jgi:micrococcal nuclease
MAELLPAGTVVRLMRDIEARDRFGRLLAYVYRDSDGLFVDLTMVVEGYAGTLSIKPNLAHRGELEAAATAAQATRRGLWQVCGGNHVPSGG